MEVFCKVMTEPEERVFSSTGKDGVQRNTTCIDVSLFDGLNVYLVTAFDVTKAQFPKKDSFIRADMRFQARSYEKDGVKRWFPSIRLNSWGVM